MSEEKAKDLGYQHVLRFVDSEITGVDPNYPATGPIPAISELLSRHSLSIQDIDLIELNEALASKVVACARELSIPFEKLNIEGGAIALGHPYGAFRSHISDSLVLWSTAVQIELCHFYDWNWRRNWNRCFMGEHDVKTEEMVQN
jgi:hypothetical protein